MNGVSEMLFWRCRWCQRVSQRTRGAEEVDRQWREAKTALSRHPRTNYGPPLVETLEAPALALALAAGHALLAIRTQSYTVVNRACGHLRTISVQGPRIWQRQRS